MNYYELIYLKRELKKKLTGGNIEQAVSPYKNYVEFFIKGNTDAIRLCFSSAPSNIALFFDTYRGAKKSNTIHFFKRIYGVNIIDVIIPETDRWVFVHFENGYQLHFRLFSNRANVFLSKQEEIVGVFKEYDEIGDKPPEPQKLDVFEVKEDISRKSTKNKIVAINAMYPRQNIQELADMYDLEDKNKDELIEFVQKTCEEMAAKPVPRLLVNGEVTLLSEKTLPIRTRKHFDGINDLILYRYKNHSNNQRLKQRKSTLLKSLKRKIKRTTSGLRNLYQADKGIERAEQYEQWGHLLMAHAHLGTVNANEIEVDDLYNEGQMVRISLEPELDIAENAQRYYKKSSNAERSYQEALKRIPIMEDEKQKAERFLEEAEAITNFWDFVSWEEKHEKALSTYRNDRGNTSDEESLPFHTFEVKGYPVWIGKNAKSNDVLVQKAHKEDIWMHARGVAGSHLVIRMGNEKGMPPKGVLLEAASYAAFNSKARGSNLAPVIITKKKYVRKVKGAPHGAVVVDKEEVEMVTPKKPHK